MSAEWVNVPKIIRTAFLTLVAIGLLSVVSLNWGGFSAQAQPPTLPPTWTPTFTPTATLTPTNTATPTPSPTLDPATFCETGFLTETLEEGASITYNGKFAAFVGSDAPDTQIVISVLHRLSGEGRVVTLPQPGYAGFELPVRLLPRHGLYDWRIALVSLDERVICEVTGYIFVGREEWLTPTEIPDATQTPVVIIVTATLSGMPEEAVAGTPMPSIQQQSVGTVAATAIPGGN